jgi:SAM-dependent methyltransferase
MGSMKKMLAKILGLGRRIVEGEDPLVARRTQVQWNAQYAKGKWDRLIDQIPPNTRSIAEMIPDGGRFRVLDVGCGNGALYAALKDHAPQMDYVGIDFSEDAIRQARERFPEARFLVGDALHPQKEWGGVFEYIIFNEVLYYVPALEVINRYERMVSNEGKIIVSMYRSWRSAIIGLMLWYKKGASITYVKGTLNSPGYFLSTILHKGMALFVVSADGLFKLINSTVIPS